MQAVREYLSKWKWQRAQTALLAAMEKHKRESDAALEMFKKDLLTEKQYDARARKIDKQLEEDFLTYHSTADWRPNITDVPAVRFALECAAWLVVYVAVMFAVHPTWANRHLEEILMVGILVGVAIAFLRLTWRRRA